MASVPQSSLLVDARDIRHRYSGVLALDGISLQIEKGSFNAILGPNGAGKSTLAQVLGGVLKPTSGTLVYPALGSVGRLGRGLVRHGVCLIPEGRRLFGQLTVEENLVVAGYGFGLTRRAIRQRVDEVVDILPEQLHGTIKSRLAMSLSGGERQMLALSRALMCNPRLIIVDEPSMGLAPIMVDKVYDVLDQLHSRGVTVVVVEQIATHAVERADVMHLLSRGNVVYSGPALGDAATEAIRSSYVGRVESHPS